MTEHNTLKMSNYSNPKRDEISVEDILHTINRRKISLFIPIISIFILVLIYNQLASPLYESQIVFKKESSYDSRYADSFQRMFSLGTMDEVDTELEIIKTRTVLETVVKELKLYLFINKLEYANGVKKEFNAYSPIYEEYVLDNGLKDNIPQFINFDIGERYKSTNFYIEIDENSYQLYEESEDSLVQIRYFEPLVNFQLDELSMSLKWSEIKHGDRFYFTIKSLESAINGLEQSMTLSREGKTNIFKLIISSKSPKMAQLIANTVAKCYRDARHKQKLQTINYSYSFVDERLEEIAQKLKDAETALSTFKSENQIAIMDESSRDVIESLSELESEKVKTDLELADYKNKLTEINRELQNKGYFDQTYLTPMTGDDIRSPFSLLLEQLSDAEIKRLELLQRRRETHPDVVALDQQISQIKSKLSEYNQNTITAYEIFIKTLQKKSNDLARLINRYSARLQELPDQEARLVELVREKNVYEKMYNLLFNKKEELKISEFSTLQDIVIVDPAKLPLKPVAPKKMLNLMLGLILGFIAGIVAIFVQEFFDKRVKTIEEVEKEYNYPILTILPKYNKNVQKKIDNPKDIKDRLVTLMSDQLIFTDPYRALRIKLLNSMTNGKNTLLFTSCEENTGKTTIVANFAVSLARAGKKVAIIDCDLRKSRISEMYEIPREYPGLIPYLTQKDADLTFYKPFAENLFILHAGGSVERSSELLGLKKMTDLLNSLYQDYDYVLIDTPPVTKIVDTFVIGDVIKDVVLIIRPNHTFKDSILLATEEIQYSKMNLLGFVINACEQKQMSGKYKYGYGYGYGDKSGLAYGLDHEGKITSNKPA